VKPFQKVAADHSVVNISCLRKCVKQCHLSVCLSHSCALFDGFRCLLAGTLTCGIQLSVTSRGRMNSWG